MLAPELPLADWLAELDKLSKRSEGYFASRPVILDVTGLAITKRDFAELIAMLYEREITQLFAEGYATREIAERLHVSVKTVGTHREHIMAKLGLHGIAQLTRYAIREGLTTLDP